MAKRVYGGADVNRIRKLVNTAKVGKSKGARTRARNELVKQLVSDAKKANSRLAALRSAGLDYGSAADSAEHWLGQQGRRRFSQSTRQSVDDMEEELLRLRAFLFSPQSTVGGQRRINKKRVDSFRDAGLVPEDMTDDDIEDFQRFLGNMSVQEYLSFYADSDDTVEALSELFKSDEDKVRDLFEEYEAFLKWREDNPLASAEEAPGLSFSEVKKEIDTLYEDLAKRRR